MEFGQAGTSFESEIIFSDKYSIKEKINYLSQSDKSNAHIELAIYHSRRNAVRSFGRKFDVSREQFFLEAMRANKRLKQ